MKKFLFILFSSLLLMSRTPLFAQNNNNIKVDKKTQEAIAIRYQRDKDYAETQGKIAANNLDQWIGHTLSELISLWGAPSRTVSDGADGQIVVYETFVSGTSGSYTPGSVSWNQYGITGYTPASDTRYNYSYTTYREVYVDKNKIITKVKTGTR